VDDAAEAKKQIEQLKNMTTLIDKIKKQRTTLANEAKQLEQSVEQEAEE
jgi:hypothetical protein